MQIHRTWTYCKLTDNTLVTRSAVAGGEISHYNHRMDETFKARRERYNSAWNRLSDILRERDALVASLARMVNAAKDSHPAAGLVVDLDAERAHDLIDQIDAYRPRITEAMQELNERGKDVGKPPVQWQD